MSKNNDKAESCDDCPAEDKESSEGASGGSKTEKKPSLLEQTTSKQSTAEWLAQLLKGSLKVKDDEPKPESVLEEVSFEGIAKFIASDKCRRIVTMAGAGISTWIPDFRSPGTGLYDNLEKYDLPSPQAVFDIQYFKENPEPFFTLCKELWPGSFKPTPCHYFIKLLEKKNKLLTHFTQNIDTLERAAGLSDDKIVEAHGTFNTGHCQKCQAVYTQAWMKEQIFKEGAESIVPKCTEAECEGVVKPDIVFFGESLPSKFMTHIADLKNCDCLIIMGTSLVVQPFASLTARTTETTPRLYINLENTFSGKSDDALMMMFMGGVSFDFEKENNIRDIFWQGTCDDGCYALADLLGWGDELRKMVKEGHAKIDKENSAAAAGKQNKSLTKDSEEKKTPPSKKSDL